MLLCWLHSSTLFLALSPDLQVTHCLHMTTSHNPHRQVTPTLPLIKPYSLWQASPQMERGVISFDQGTLAVFVWCMEPRSGSQLTCRGVIRCPSWKMHNRTTTQRVDNQAVGGIHRGVTIDQSQGREELHPWTVDQCGCVNWLAFRWREEKCDGKKTKQNTDSLFLWFICWFIPRCEYDSMFVQDDVILNVDIFF